MNELIQKVFVTFRISVHKLLNRKLYNNGVILFGVPFLLHRNKISIGHQTRINPSVSLYGHGGI